MRLAVSTLRDRLRGERLAARAIGRFRAAAQHFHRLSEPVGAGFRTPGLGDPANVFLLVAVAELVERGPYFFLLEQLLELGRYLDSALRFVLLDGDFDDVTRAFADLLPDAFNMPSMCCGAPYLIMEPE